MHFGKGERKAGHAAGAQDGDALAGLDAPCLNHRVPGRERRARQRCCLFETQVIGNFDRAGLVERHIVRQHAVDHAAERIPRCIGRNAAACPIDEKGAGHAITWLDLRHARTNGSDFASTIGQRDHREFRVAVNPLDDTLIAIIQRCGTHAHEDLSMARLRFRTRAIDHQSVKTGGIAHLIGLHAVSVCVSSMPATLLSALRRLPNMVMPSAMALRRTA